MSLNDNQHFYLNKAAIHQKYADYYKYRNPSLHIYYYLKHIKYIKEASKSIRYNLQSREIHSNLPAKVRILHDIQSIPYLDFHIDDKPMITKLPLREAKQYHSVLPGKHQIDIYQTEDLNSPFIHKKAYFEPGKYYTLILTENAAKPKLIAFEDQPSVPAGEAKIKFIHLSPKLKTVDIAVKKRDVIFPTLIPLHSTSYLGVTPMTLELEARGAGEDDVALSLPALKLHPNTAYTAIISTDEVLLLKDQD